MSPEGPFSGLSLSSTSPEGSGVLRSSSSPSLAEGPFAFFPLDELEGAFFPLRRGFSPLGIPSVPGAPVVSPSLGAPKPSSDGSTDPRSAPTTAGGTSGGLSGARGTSGASEITSPFLRLVGFFFESFAEGPPSGASVERGRFRASTEDFTSGKDSATTAGGTSGNPSPRSPIGRPSGARGTSGASEIPSPFLRLVGFFFESFAEGPPPGTSTGAFSSGASADAFPVVAPPFVFFLANLGESFGSDAARRGSSGAGEGGTGSGPTPFATGARDRGAFVAPAALRSGAS